MFSEFLRAMGVPNSVGAIYGLLFASPEKLCFTHIVEELEMSKGSVSQGLTFLRQSGAINVVSVRDDRREFFEPELGLRRLAGGGIREKLQPLARGSRASLIRLRREAARGAIDKRSFQMRRVEQLETRHRQLGNVIPVVTALLSATHK